MKALLKTSFDDAVQRYTQKESRGYKKGFFTDFRHSYHKTEKMASLERAISNSQDDEAVLAVVVEHLLSKSSHFHNHSFNSYFIDELNKRVPHIDWNCFTPKAIETYQGAVYRGTSQAPEKIFKDGFLELQSSDEVESYLKFRNHSVGISTTKDFQTALEYATSTRRSRPDRYVYVINYRDHHGYDVLETGKSRGLSFNRLFHKDRFSGWKKREVNIKDRIKPEDIVGAWKIEQNNTMTWIENNITYRLPPSPRP